MCFAVFVANYSSQETQVAEQDDLVIADEMELKDEWLKTAMRNAYDFTNAL